MSTMPLFFLGRRQSRSAKIQQLDKETAQIHKENMETIAFALKKADNLKQVLEANGITLNIAKATGHKHNGHRNIQPTLQHPH